MATVTIKNDKGEYRQVELTEDVLKENPELKAVIDRLERSHSSIEAYGNNYERNHEHDRQHSRDRDHEKEHSRGS